MRKTVFLQRLDLHTQEAIFFFFNLTFHDCLDGEYQIAYCTVWYLTSDTARMIRFVQQRLQSLWCLDKSHPAEQTRTSVSNASLSFLVTSGLTGRWSGACGKLIALRTETWRHLSSKAHRSLRLLNLLQHLHKAKLMFLVPEKFSDRASSFLLTAHRELLTDNWSLSNKTEQNKT